jgi:hypothetical protein
VAVAYNFHKTWRTFDVYMKFELLKVKVPINFLGTVGFSLRRDGR